MQGPHPVNLPDYFLADLTGAAAVTPTIITEACVTLKRNRRQYLAGRTTADLIDTLAAWADDWLDPSNPFRQEALASGPRTTGFSKGTLEAGLDALFGSVTPEGLRALVAQDLGHPERLDALTRSEPESLHRRAAMARGPELLAHITAGRLPNPVCASLVLGLLTRSAQFFKCATGTAFLPLLLAHSLREIEPKLGACIEIAEWKGGNEPLEQALFSQADCVSAMGSDATLAALRRHVHPPTTFLGYGHRLSFGYVARELLTSHHLHHAATTAARDVAAWDQLGCLSPHVLYAESGGRQPPEAFAEELAAALDACEQNAPRRLLPPGEAAIIAQRRAFYEIRAAHGRDTQLWCSPGSTAWTVVFEKDPRFQVSCLNRFVYVKSVANLEETLQAADPVRHQVSTVGLAAGARERALAQAFSTWGAPRVCPLGRMQQPPLAWRHDGRPSLGDLVRWTDWEPTPSEDE